MNSDRPPPTPEGALLAEAARRTGRSARSLARQAGISDTHWRYVTRGWRHNPAGGPALRVHAPAGTLARMAAIVGLNPDDLIKASRPDAAEVLFGLTLAGTCEHGPVLSTDEIDLVFSSKTMSPAEKLTRIRQILILRAEIEAPQTTRRGRPSRATTDD